MVEPTQSRRQRTLSTYYWAFLYALCFLTRIPTPYLKRFDKQVEQAAIHFYPVVGVILGGLLILLVELIGWYNPQASLLLVAVLLLGLWIYSTGAMHLDGVADLGDAWVGGLGNPERALEIMKDPRIGSMGAASMLVVLLLKLAGLYTLLELHQQHVLSLMALLIIPVMARVGIVALMASMSYLRTQGMGSNIKDASLWSKLLPMLALVGLLLLVFASAKFWLILGGWLAWLVVYRWAINKRYGGYTGDMLGAAVELQEAFLLVLWVL